MRLIDADKLLKFFTVDTANQTYRFGTVKKQIESAPTVQAIQLEKLKEILDDYDGSIPSMITQFSKIQKLVESEE